MRFLIAIVLSIICIVSFSQEIGYTQTGKASFYGPNLHGKRTASGERFNMNSYTAAHKTLPYGSYLKVTNTSNNKSVIVRVNDRGPYSHERIIDVSWLAAKKLGIVRNGKALVRIEVLDPKIARKSLLVPKKEPKLNQEQKNNIILLSKMKNGNTYTLKGRLIRARGFGVEIGRFTSKRKAADFMIKHKDKNPILVKMIKKEKKTIYRIVSGNYSSLSVAQKHQNSLKPVGLNGPIRQN